MAQNCPYCREAISPPERRVCPACQTPHHRDCWEENGGCTVFGCEHAPADEPKISLSPQEVVPLADPPRNVAMPPVPPAPAPGAAASYFLARDGARHGPYTLEELRLYHQRGQAALEDLAWMPGLPNWIPLAHFLGPAPGLPGAVSGDPCPGRLGFGRLYYALSLLAVLVVAWMLQKSPESAGVGRLFLLFSVPLTVLRLRDLGMSGWIVLLSFLPHIPFRLLFAPRGFAITKQADVPLRVMTWVTATMVAMVIVLFVLSQVIH